MLASAPFIRAPSRFVGRAATTMSTPSSPPAILVTGASSGIGLALSKQLLLERGARVFLCSRDLGRGQEAIASLALPAEAAKRCSLVQLDATSDDSVAAAASTVAAALGGEKLYAIVNNAGVGLQSTGGPELVIDTNLRGPRRVVDAFLPLLQPQGGRIVNVGSGSGPSFVKNLGETDAARRMIATPRSWQEIEELVALHLGSPADTNGGYGVSKALLASYTQMLAEQHPGLICATCSPGFINTKLTAGFGATKTPDEGTVAIKQLLFQVGPEASGQYFGSDAVRSPLHYMRNPGEPAYDGAAPFS